MQQPMQGISIWRYLPSLVLGSLMALLGMWSLIYSLLTIIAGLLHLNTN